MSTPTYKYINKLKARRVLIFGGTSGIGYAVAQGVIENGGTVLISGSNEAKLDKTVERLTTSYPNISSSQILTHVCDLSDANALETNLTSLFTKFSETGKINHVVFTAGDKLGGAPSLSDATVEKIHKFHTVRGIAPIIIAKFLPDYMEKSPDSSYTLTSGVGSIKPRPGWTIVAALGASLEGLTRGLAVDLAPVRTNLVSPGPIDTELLSGYPAEARDLFVRATTVKKIGRPEDVAEAYLYCMKDGFVTGTRIDSCGGMLLT